MKTALRYHGSGRKVPACLGFVIWGVSDFRKGVSGVYPSVRAGPERCRRLVPCVLSGFRERTSQYRAPPVNSGVDGSGLGLRDGCGDLHPRSMRHGKDGSSVPDGSSVYEVLFGARAGSVFRALIGRDEHRREFNPWWAGS